MIYVLYIFIGILISELICYLVALTNDATKTFIAGSFVFYYLFNGIFTIIRKVRTKIIRNGYVAVSAYFILNGNVTHLTTYRAKNKWLKKYYTIENPNIISKNNDTLIYYLEVSAGKYVENAESIRKIKREKVYTQEWVNTYLVKKENNRCNKKLRRVKNGI